VERSFRSEVNSVFHDALANLVVRIRSSDLTLDDQELMPYMVTIATNVLRSQVRKKEHRLSTGTETLDGTPADGNAPDVAAEERDLVAKYRELLATLPEQCRRLVQLRIDEDLSFAEIGELLDMKENSARARYADCLARLRRLGGDLSDEEIRRG